MSFCLQNLPFVRLLFPFLGGIVLQYHFNYQNSSVAGILISFFILFLTYLPYLKNNYSFRFLWGLSLFGACFFIGAFLMQLKIKEIEWDVDTKQYCFNVKLLEDPEIKAKSLKCKGLIPENNKKVIVYLLTDNIASELNAGDIIQIKAKFRKFDNNERSEFEYTSYMKKQGFSGYAFVKKGDWIKLDNSDSFNLKLSAIKIRKILLCKMKQIIPDEKNYSIAAALALGYKDALEKDMKTTFSKAGASHILVVSGLHMAIVYGAVYYFLFFFNRNHILKMCRHLLALCIIWIFAFISGLSPSVVRAAIMITFIEAGRMLGKKPYTLNTVGAAAFLMLIYNPLYIFDLSFQLSYSAVISIVLLNPILSRMIVVQNRILKYLIDLSCVSVSAQIGTVPLTVYYFHQFPNFFILTNLFVIPLSGFLLIFLFLALFMQSIFSSDLILFKALNYLLHFFISGVEYIEELPHSITENIYINQAGVVLLYLFFLFTGLLLRNRRAVYACILVLLVVLSLIYYL